MARYLKALLEDIFTQYQSGMFLLAIGHSLDAIVGAQQAIALGQYNAYQLVVGVFVLGHQNQWGCIQIGLGADTDGA